MIVTKSGYFTPFLSRPIPSNPFSRKSVCPWCFS